MDTKKETNEFLKEQLERVNYWLSFAEAKNGILIAVNIALMTFVSDLLSYAPMLCAFILSCMVISSIICIASFIPNLKTHADIKGTNTDVNALNLLFYSDIAKLKEEQYADLLKDKYKDVFDEHSFNSSIAKDYISEIHINSIITNRKYCYFRVALDVDLVPLALCIVLFIIA